MRNQETGSAATNCSSRSRGKVRGFYMAEQLEPVRRGVALKVIKLGMDTKAVIARFEAERQALALMDHPNIAKHGRTGGVFPTRQPAGDRQSPGH